VCVYVCACVYACANLLVYLCVCVCADTLIQLGLWEDMQPHWLRGRNTKDRHAQREAAYELWHIWCKVLFHPDRLVRVVWLKRRDLGRKAKYLLALEYVGVSDPSIALMNRLGESLVGYGISTQNTPLDEPLSLASCDFWIKQYILLVGLASLLPSIHDTHCHFVFKGGRMVSTIKSGKTAYPSQMKHGYDWSHYYMHTPKTKSVIVKHGDILWTKYDNSNVSPNHCMCPAHTKHTALVRRYTPTKQ
jgi:hypothetical protein